MPNISPVGGRPLFLSVLVSLGMHAGLVAALWAFPVSSPPKLQLQMGDVCFNVYLASLGPPNLGSGSSSTGDGPGDGFTVVLWRNVPQPAEDTDAPPAAELKTEAPPAPDVLAVKPAAADDRPKPTDAAITDTVRQADEQKPVGDSDRTDQKAPSQPEAGHTPSAKLTSGTGTPAGAASTGGSVGIRSGARLSGQMPPTYPVEAQRQGLEGDVMLSLKVAADGTVPEVKLHRGSGHGILDEAALRWARSLHFVPARQDGRPVPVDVLLPVRYRLVGR